MAPTRYTLVDLDGDLCVLYETTLDSEPVIQRIWWPTGQRTAGIRSSYGPSVLDQPLERNGWSEHGYRFADRSLPRLTIQLRERGQTEAVKVERIPAPAPPAKIVRGKPVRWHNGEWVRDLAAGPQSLGVVFPAVQIGGMDPNATKSSYGIRISSDVRGVSVRGVGTLEEARREYLRASQDASEETVELVTIGQRGGVRAIDPWAGR